MMNNYDKIKSFTKINYNLIIEYFKYGVVDLNIIEFTNEYTNKILDCIANFNNIILCFDIEFQNSLMVNDVNNINKFFYEHTSFKKKSFPFIREFGSIMFIKENNWFYVGSLIVNFHNLNTIIDNKYIRYTSAPYSSVTEKTFNKMTENDNNLTNNNNEFNNINLFELFPCKSKFICNDINAKIIYEQNNLYWNDPLVKSRLINNNQSKNFIDILLKLSKKSMCVIKGQTDLYVIKNHFYLLNNKEFPTSFKYLYDIQVFNTLSHIYFSSSKLEVTAKSFIEKKDFPKDFDFLLDNLKAHNPVSDSIYTFCVCYYINMLLFNSLKN